MIPHRLLHIGTLHPKIGDLAFNEQERGHTPISPMSGEGGVPCEPCACQQTLSRNGASHGRQSGPMFK
jgi:hypothetical protein